MLRTARIGGANMIRTLCIILVFACVSAGEDGWSRQLSDSASEWVPLQSVLSKRQATPRVLNLPAPFHANNFFPAETYQEYVPQEASRQIFLQSPPQEQAFLNRQNGLNQPIQLTLMGRFNPLAPTFIPRIEGEIKYNDFRKSIQDQFRAQPPLPPQTLNNQFFNRAPTLKPLEQDAPRYVDGYKVENVSGDFLGSTLITPAVNQEKPKPVEQIITEKSSVLPTTPTVTTVEKEEVELLYVPLETLRNKNFDAKRYMNAVQKSEIARDSVGSPIQINNQLFSPTPPTYLHTQKQLQNIQQELQQQAANTKNLQGTFLNQNQFQRQPKYQQPSPTPFPFSQSFSPQIAQAQTPRPNKLKAHQPPLAVYMVHREEGSPKLVDVLARLKESKSISVLDYVTPNSPDVFIGPSNLKVPERYSKFELPYLSSIDGSKLSRKIDHLPFFVAPLSYKAPEGFAKIPFPAPHVGSVIVNPFMTSADDFPQPTDTTSYFGFSQDPTTESFRATSPKSNGFSFFPSATPTPGNVQGTTAGFASSFEPFEQFQFNQFRQQSTRKPEPTFINSSRPPTNAFFSTSARPSSVSFFGFPGQNFNTGPTTVKPPTPLVYENRGHYITNAAIDNTNPTKQPTISEITTQKLTSPITSTSPKYETQNPYSINSAFALKNPYEPVDFRTSIRGNEIRHFNLEQSERVPQQNEFNSFVQSTQKYPQFPAQQRPVVELPSDNDYSPRPYVNQIAPSSTSARPPPQVTETSTPEEYEVYRTKNKESFTEYTQFTNPTAQAEDDEVTQQVQYETEAPSTTTTTTTTTTTAAPTTSKSVFGRRPIHSRGRPRYTTPKPDESETTISSTTRRVPIRERRPNTFRTKLESARTSTTTTTESSVDSNNFDSVKKPARDYGKFSTRNRSRPQDNEDRTTTEAPVEKTTTRSLRGRSRGRTHFKKTDNYDGDYVPKKKVKEEENNLAYQRDVLHQNYPVTLSERRTTLEVRTTTAMPSSRDDGKIKIYETTSNTQRPYSVQETSSTEASLAYSSAAVFQGEDKYVTQPELNVEINGVSASAQPIIDNQETPTYEVSTESIQFSSTPRIEKLPQVSEQITESELIANTENMDIGKHHDVHSATPIPYAPDVILTEEPMPKFRSKLRPRPKLLPSLNIPKNDDEYQSIYSDTFVTRKAEDDNTDNRIGFTRRVSSVSPSTYRPAFSNRRTTMRIEEIEEELKSKRTQVKGDSRSTTFKYPVYIPEATSTAPKDAEAPTTRRTHFVRRRPVRPTTTASDASAQLDVTTESYSSVKPTSKRVRVRGRVRARPTTEKVDISSTAEERFSPSFSSPAIPDEKYATSTPKIDVQRFRGRTPTQRFFKRPLSLPDKNQPAEADIEDQASFDSINRPEFVPFSAKSEISQQKPDSGSDSQWSPKLTYNSFKPFNPNVIADEVKVDAFEFGTKIYADGPEIITARNPYEDVLIAVTPASNNLNRQPTNENLRKEKSAKAIPEVASTFESVLEEVMRNLEEQDENEYNKDYVAVMKHEGGEIGEIPPESTVETDYAKANTEFDANSSWKTTPEIPPTTITSETVFGIDRSFTKGPEDVTPTSTERKPRRRGFWRKVRPVNRDMLETAESQFYKDTSNDLLKEREKTRNTKLRQRVKPTHPITTTPLPQVEKIETIQTTIPSTTVPEQEIVTEKNQERLETEAPFVPTEIFTPEEEVKEDIEREEAVTEAEIIANVETEHPIETFELENKTEYLMSNTESPVPLEEADETEEATETIETKTTIMQTNEVTTQKINTTTENRAEIEEQLTTEYEIDAVTTEVPESEQTELKTMEKAIEMKSKSSTEVKSFSEAMEEILTEIENKKENDDPKQDIIIKKDEIKSDGVDSLVPGFKYLDPKSIIGTSVSKEISQETEICYRGKCIKSKKLDHIES